MPKNPFGARASLCMPMSESRSPFSSFKFASLMSLMSLTDAESELILRLPREPFEVTRKMCERRFSSGFRRKNLELFEKVQETYEKSYLVVLFVIVLTVVVVVFTFYCLYDC